MYINNVNPVTIKANPVRRLIPLSEYKGPILDLRFWEEDEIKLLNKQLLALENEAGDIIRTMDINTRLTGYQINKCKYKLFDVKTSIDEIKRKIFQIKKERFAKQKAEIAQKSI